MADHLDTQNPADVAIDEAGRNAQGSAQWFLENDPRVKKYYGNKLDFLICGQEGFASIAQCIASARETVEIICWGFDPAMELVRSGNTWRRGQTYGDLLEKTAQRGVKVRLLVWHNRDGVRVSEQHARLHGCPAEIQPVHECHAAGELTV